MFHTLFSECLVLLLVYHVYLPFSNISNNCQWDIKLNLNYISRKDVIYSRYTASKGMDLALNLV